MQMAMSKTRSEFPLSRKKIWKKIIGSTLGEIFSLVVLYAMYVLAAYSYNLSGDSRGMNTIGLVRIIVLSWIIFRLCWRYVYQVWYWQSYFYDLTDEYIVIRKGPFTPREITVPYGRVQDVYVDQDVLDRILGLYDVHVSSATSSSGMEAHIDGLERPAAEGLRAVLLGKIGAGSVKPKGQG